MSAKTTAQIAHPVFVDRDWIVNVLGLKLSRMQISRLIEAGRLPRPLKMSPGKASKCFWRREALEAALARLEADGA